MPAMATKFCTNCGGEYVQTVEECPDCELPLVDELPTDGLSPEPAAAEGQVEYELADWAGESRNLLE
jgi:hypothetical protein